ncbi:hypothetical protein H311_00948 [Anncaliia algerae PRA109]|nr:hypothetical protein H311_00948 [Anncaliia algerae PRA109]
MFLFFIANIWATEMEYLYESPAYKKLLLWSESLSEEPCNIDKYELFLKKFNEAKREETGQESSNPASHGKHQDVPSLMYKSYKESFRNDSEVDCSAIDELYDGFERLYKLRFISKRKLGFISKREEKVSHEFFKRQLRTAFWGTRNGVDFTVEKKFLSILNDILDETEKDLSKE